jgi:hypothetical protein
MNKLNFCYNLQKHLFALFYAAVIIRRTTAMRRPLIPVVTVDHPFSFHLLQIQARKHVVLFRGRLAAPNFVSVHFKSLASSHAIQHTKLFALSSFYCRLSYNAFALYCVCLANLYCMLLSKDRR